MGIYPGGHDFSVHRKGSGVYRTDRNHFKRAILYCRPDWQRRTGSTVSCQRYRSGYLPGSERTAFGKKKRGGVPAASGSSVAASDDRLHRAERQMFSGDGIYSGKISETASGRRKDIFQQKKSSPWEEGYWISCPIFIPENRLFIMEI